MKKIIYFTLYFTLTNFAYSSNDVIDLRNKIPPSLDDSQTRDKDETKNSKTPPKMDNDFTKLSDNLILPKSIYIGELGDNNSFNKNNNALLNIANIFIESIKNNKKIESLDSRFEFVFYKVHKDLIQNGKNITFWSIGQPQIYQDRAQLQIELHFREKIITGILYLEYSESWLIYDLQINDQEKRFFDPSSIINPNLY